jgi:hypothetical protein
MASKLSFRVNVTTVKPVLTTTSEQRPPVNKGQPDPRFSKFVGNL